MIILQEYLNHLAWIVAWSIALGMSLVAWGLVMWAWWKAERMVRR